MTIDSPDVTTENPARRRWHAVAITVAVIAFAMGVFLNVPGEPISTPDIFETAQYGPHFVCYPRHIAHGWPLRFLEHTGPTDAASLSYNLPAPYRFGAPYKFDVWKLLANTIFTVGVSLVIGWLAQRHITKYSFGFGLANIAVLVVAISCILGYGTYRYRLQQAQMKQLEVSLTETDYRHLEWETLGPYWLRSLTGEACWNWGDRLLAAEPRYYEDIESFPGKSSIKILRPYEIRLDQPFSLEGYDQLVALDLYFVNLPGDGPISEDGKTPLTPLMREIARCQRLEGLNFYDLDMTDRDLELLANMPRLMNLELSSNPDITDAGLLHLASIKSLQKLGLQGTSVTEAGVNKLQAAIPNCFIYWRDSQNPNAIRLP